MKCIWEIFNIENLKIDFKMSKKAFEVNLNPLGIKFLASAINFLQRVGKDFVLEAEGDKVY